MENDFDTDFETTDLDTGMDDFDPTEPTESVKDRQGDANDAIASMLLSGSTEALDDFGESDGKSFNMGHIRDTDSTRGERPAKSEPASFEGNRSAPDNSAQARISQVDATSQQVMQAWEDLQAMQSDLPPEVFAERQQYLQGQAAGLTIQRQQAQIDLMNDQQWLAQQEAQVREKHADVFNDPQKRDLYSKKMIDYLGKIGYSSDELTTIGAREYNAVLDMIKVTEERDKLKLENAKYKQEHRKRQQSLKRGKRDIEAGAGRSTKGGSDVYDEVARVLMTPRRG